MTANRTSQAPLALLISGFVVLIAIGAACGLLMAQARSSSQWVNHSFVVERQIADLLLALRRAESAERAFLITQDEADLDDYQTSASQISSQVAMLRRLVADNPLQVSRVQQMAPIIQTRLDDLERATLLRQQNRSDEANAVVRRAEKGHVMDQILSIAHAMTSEEQNLLRQRGEQSNRTYQLLFATTIGGGLLIVILAVTAVAIVRRSSAELHEAQARLIATNENLEALVEERSRDLIAANEEIQRFAYIVSHDLRSPLVNIMGFTSELETLRQEIFERMAALRGEREIAQQVAGQEAGAEDEQDEDDVLGSEFDEAISFIKSSITKMDRLIGAVLKLSREGRREFNLEWIDMNALIGELTATVAHQALEAEAEFEVGPLPTIYSDRLAIEQIFSNLIDNALKYLRPDAPGEIKISGSETPFHVVYQVSDNGRGIEEKDHQRIFELFRRSGEQDRPGEGIGLANVQTLVRRLSGQLQVESKLGEGSVFTVRLAKQWPQKKERNVA